MLHINKEQVEVFEQLQFVKLKHLISDALLDNLDQWNHFDKKKQNQLINFLFLEAQNAKMIYDIEFILFALVCMSTETDCQTFLRKTEVKNILLGESETNPEKLIKLSELTAIEIIKKKGSWEINRRKNNV